MLLATYVLGSCWTAAVCCCRPDVWCWHIILLDSPIWPPIMDAMQHMGLLHGLLNRPINAIWQRWRRFGRERRWVLPAPVAAGAALVAEVGAQHATGLMLASCHYVPTYMFTPLPS